MIGALDLSGLNRVENQMDMVVNKQQIRMEQTFESLLCADMMSLLFQSGDETLLYESNVINQKHCIEKQRKDTVLIEPFLLCQSNDNVQQEDIKEDTKKKPILEYDEIALLLSNLLLEQYQYTETKIEQVIQNSFPREIEHSETINLIDLIEKVTEKNSYELEEVVIKQALEFILNSSQKSPLDILVGNQNTFFTKEIFDFIPCQKQQLVNQILDKIQVSTWKDESEVQIDLTPRELGQMTIKVSAAQGIVRALIQVESYYVKDTVQLHLQELTKELQIQGLNLGGVQVEVKQEQQQHYERQKHKSQKRIKEILQNAIQNTQDITQIEQIRKNTMVDMTI